MSVLTLLILYFAAFAVGNLASRRYLRAHLLVGFHPIQVLMIETMLGVGILGTVALLGNWAGILPRPIAILIPSICALAGLTIFARQWPFSTSFGRVLASPRNIAGALGFLAFFVILFRLAWYPVLEFDASVYHFTVPKQWLMHGRLIEVPYEASANYYLLAQAWYFWGIAFATDDTILPHLQTLVAMCALGVFILLELRPRIGEGPAWIFTLAYLFSDDIVEFAARDYIDPQQGFFVLVGCLLAARALSKSGSVRSALLVTSGLLIGFATGMKIMAVAVAAAIVSVIFLNSMCKTESRQPWKIAIKNAAQFLIPLAITLLPWIAKNACFTGNPVYPFALNLFPTFHEHIGSAKELQGVYSDFFTPTSFAGSISIRLMQIVKSMRLANYMDQPLFLWLFVAGMLWSILRKFPNRETTIAFSIAALLIPFTIFSPARRFSIGPSAFQYLLFASLAGSIWQGAIRNRRRMMTSCMLAALSLYTYVHVSRISTTIQTVYPARTIYAPTAYITAEGMRESYIARIPAYPMVEYIEATSQPGDLVLTIGVGMAIPLLDVPIFENSHVNGKNIISTFADEEGNDAAQIAARLSAYHITHVLALSPLAEGGEAGKFVRDYLRPVRASDGATFYRVEKNPAQRD